jgi:glycosyltransferase involved in cell wall biosynthesis
MGDISISAIVPAYNEEKTIKRVIEDLLKVDILSEITVIDDGSRDGSRNILETFGESARLKILFNDSNKGKGYGVARGLEVSHGEIVLILDADIINYTANDLSLLIDPILSGGCDYTMKMTDDPHTKFTSGVRAYLRRDLMPLLDRMKNTTRYGLEVMLNKYLNHKRSRYVTLKDYKHFNKFKKYSLPRAMWEYAKEGMSILLQMIRDDMCYS